MEDLPPELLRLILSYFTNLQRKSISRVCKIFSYLKLTFKHPSSYTSLDSVSTYKHSNIYNSTTVFQNKLMYMKDSDIMIHDGLTETKFNTTNINDNSICVTTDNQIIVVVETYKHTITIFNNNGKYIRRFGSYGIVSGLFRYPRGAAIDGNMIFVTDSFNKRIQVFNIYGIFLFMFGNNEHFQHPHGICTSRKNVYVTDTGVHNIQIFDKKGNLIRIFGEIINSNIRFYYPTNIVVTDENLIIVLDVNIRKIMIFDINFKLIFILPQFDFKEGLAIFDDGKIVCTTSSYFHFFELHFD